MCCHHGWKNAALTLKIREATADTLSKEVFNVEQTQALVC